VHCFRRGVVGLRAHRELGIEQKRSLDGLGMPDFTNHTVPPERAHVPRRRHGKEAPARLLIISRCGTRLLLNTEAVANDIAQVGQPGS